MKSLAIIPARAGSKRLPSKNRETVGGVPLWLRAINCAHMAHISEIVLVTDDKTIADEARPLTASIPFRVLDEPEDVAADDVAMIRVLQLAIQIAAPCDAVVLLQPTSPLRTADDVAAALSIYARSGCDAVVSLRDAGAHRYERNGAIYITRPDLIRRGEIIGGWTQFYVMPADRSVDVDTAEDLAEARRLCGS